MPEKALKKEKEEKAEMDKIEEKELMRGEVRE
jgi:hypothetical protein